MKADVLSGLDTIRVCTGYRINGKVVQRMPFDITDGVEPVYEELPGWGATDHDAPIPEALEHYIQRIERTVEVPVTLVSLGPDRTQTVLRTAHAIG